MGAPRRGGARRWQWQWRAAFQGAGRRVGARIGVEWRGEGPERVPVEAAGESRTEVAARRGGGAGVEAEAAAAHQDGLGGGGQASRRRRRDGKRSRCRGGSGGRPG